MFCLAGLAVNSNTVVAQFFDHHLHKNLKIYQAEIFGSSRKGFRNSYFFDLATGPKNWVLEKNGVWIIEIHPKIKKLQQF